MSSHQPSHTFRRRLTVSMTLLSVAVLAVATAVIYWRVRQAWLSHLDSTLLSIARIEIASSLDQAGGRLHVHDEIPVSTAPLGLGYEKFAQIKDETHQVRAQTSNLKDGPTLETDQELEAQALQGQVMFGDMQHGQEVHRGVYYPARDIAGRPLVAVVAIPEHPLRRSLNSLLWALALALFAGAGAAAFVAKRLARQLTRPLEEIAAAADAVGGASLQARIPEVSSDFELRQVTRVLNEMLKRLEAAFVTQRNFAADASHELRSPLANLRGTIEVALRRSRPAEEYREALTVALIEAERLTRLVNDLLMLSRIDAQQLALDIGTCDLADIAHDAIAAVAAVAQEKGLNLRVDGQTATVRGDASRLRQAVDNLVDNALRYAPAGSEVKVQTYRQGGHTVLSVQDSGPGLSLADQARIFDRFYRVDTSRARDSGGLGLGLPITKAIVQAHHGEISVHSQPGSGCLFRIILPTA